MVPKQRSTGGRAVLLGISNRGDKHLRSLFIHGAHGAERTSTQRHGESERGRIATRALLDSINVATLAGPCPPGQNDALLYRPMTRATTFKMIKRRAAHSDLPRDICGHSFCGTGITEYLRRGGDLKVSTRIADHESTRTTQLYNRLREEISLDEIERIHI